MISKTGLTQALAMIGATTNDAVTRPIDTFSRLNSYRTPRRGKYGRNLNRPRKLLRRIKTTC